LRSANVTAVASASASIGAGYAYGGQSSVDVVDISDSKISALTVLYGAGIGGGTGAYNGRSDIGAIVIANSTVTATGRQSAAICSGSGYLSNSTVGAISLTGGSDNLFAGWGAGVGAGDSMMEAAPGRSLVHNISISGGSFVVAGRTGFGATD
jgi:hypothetical protein